ncbi:allergen Cr-PI-like isoform X3 [Schistocerca americana]|nr:allergen Cr-PI-like isoform X3 [Schistocerca americana]XP_046990475.1 allergen Cr-PI-like isoform X3 [Schistocerca americana]
MNSRGFLAGRGQTFSIHQQGDIELARVTVELLLSAQDFDTFYSAATWAKQRLSEALFSYAFTVAVLRRNDTSDVVLPAPYELWPRYFVGPDVLRRAYDARLRGAAADGERPQTVLASSNQRHSGCPEDLLSYFREDVGLNGHWAMKHFRCPFWLSGSVSASSCDRRGELFYFALRQLAARYDLERLSAGLEPVQPLQYPTVYQETYHSDERVASELRCAPEGEAFLSDTPHVWALKIFEERICDAIDVGYAVDKNYTEHPLRRPEAIEILGNIVEGNADSLNENFYGSLYRGLLTSFSQSEAAFPAKQVPTFMENPATALRDPLFYRAVKKLLGVFNRFQDRLGRYKREELEFPGVRVESVLVKPLSTHLEQFEFELDNGLPEVNSSRPRLLARQRRLTARPFQYQLAVASQHDADVDALLRVYLGPRRRPGQLDHDRHRFVLFDAFRASCKLALKKWSQTRDSWMKSVKKRHEQKSSTFPARPSRLYLYHEQMLFLNKVIETSVSQDSYFPQESTPTNVTNEASKTAQYEKIYEYIPKPEIINNYTTQRKRKSDIKIESDVEMTFSDNQPCREHCGCRHMAFFNSLLPSLSLLDDNETLKFQSEVLSVLQNIKRKRSESS